MRDVGLGILALGLFAGGVVLLYLKIPFWSLLLGIAAVQIGIVLVILTFDAFIRRGKKPLTDDYKTVGCVVCQAPTFVPKYQNVVMCDNCQVRAARAFKAAGLLVFTIFTIASGVALVQQNQDIAEKAAGEKKLCEGGNWSPPSCRCGVWLQGSDARVCEDGIIRSCLETSTQVWKCN